MALNADIGIQFIVPVYDSNSIIALFLKWFFSEKVSKVQSIWEDVLWMPIARRIFLMSAHCLSL